MLPLVLRNLHTDLLEQICNFFLDVKRVYSLLRSTIAGPDILDIIRPMGNARKQFDQLQHLVCREFVFVPPFAALIAELEQNVLRIGGIRDIFVNDLLALRLTLRDPNITGRNRPPMKDQLLVNSQ